MLSRSISLTLVNPSSSQSTHNAGLVGCAEDIYIGAMSIPTSTSRVSPRRSVIGMSSANVNKAMSAVVVVALALGALTVVAAPARAEVLEVVSVAGNLPEARVYPTAVEMDGSLYVFGGFVSDLYGIAESGLDTVMIYDIETGETSFGASMPQGAALMSAAVGNDGQIYVFGGYNNSFGYTRTVQIYDTAADLWSTGADAPLRLGGGQAICAPDGRFYLFGAGLWSSLNSTMIYDPIADSWEYGADQLGLYATGGAVLLNDTAILVCGGYDGFSGLATNVANIYDIPSNSWTSASSMPQVANFGAAGMSRDGYAYFIGGTTGDWTDTGVVLGTIQVYDPATDEWYVSSTTIPARDSFALATDGLDRFFVIGGYNGAATQSSVIMLLSAEFELDTFDITSPSDGSVVRGDVAVTGIRSNAWVDVFAVDFYVDGVLTASQFSSPSETQWTFLWGTDGLVDGSTHVLMLRVFLDDGSIVEDSVTVTYSAYTLDERLDMLESELSSVQDALDAQALALSSLQDSSDATQLLIDVLQADIDALAAELASLSADVADMDSANADRIAALEAQVADLGDLLDTLQSSVDDAQSSVDDVQDSVDGLQDAVDNLGNTTEEVQSSVDNKMDSVLGFAVIGLLVLVVVLLLVMMVMGRKSIPPPPMS